MPIVRCVEPQRPPRQNDQRHHEERPRYTDRNPRDDRHYRNRRNNNDSDEEEPKDEEYRGNHRYNKGGYRYDNHRLTNKRGGFNGPCGKYRQYRDQWRYDESLEDDRYQESRRDQLQAPRNSRRLKQDQDEQEEHMERHTPPAAGKGESNVHCFVCK